MQNLGKSTKAVIVHILGIVRKESDYMWVDVIIVVILIYTFIQGFRHGFVRTFINTLGWLLAVILGFVWYPYVIDFLKNKTDFYDSVHAKIIERISENAGAASDSALTGIPDVIKEVIDKAINTATDTITVSVADGLSNIIFNIIGFLVVAIAIKLLLLFITSLFSKTSNEGLVGIIDGFFGFLAGGLKGIIIVYILLALMVPITSLTGSEFIIDKIDSSVIGNYLYNNNLIFWVVKGFLN